MMINYSCTLCGSTLFQPIYIPPYLPCVSSDDKPLKISSELLVCKHCGHIQKYISKRLLYEINKIYETYILYGSSNGKESLVFEQSGIFARSSAVINFLSSLMDIPDQGNFLDFGCGNGAVSRSFKKKFPNWHLSAYDNNFSFKEQIKKFDNRIDFYSAPLDNIKNKFDLIIANYAVEHVLDLRNTMPKLGNLLKDNGVLIVTVPSFIENSFDLMVVDHCSHFTKRTIALLAELAHLSVVQIDTTHIKRAIIAVFKKNVFQKSTFSAIDDAEKNITNVKRSISWLNQIYHDVKDINGDFAMFGTATASGWLTGIVNDKIKYYVDEDPNRSGHTHFGKPIMLPADVSKDILVYLGLPYSLATMLKKKLQKKYPLINFIEPPPF